MFKLKLNLAQAEEKKQEKDRKRKEDKSAKEEESNQLLEEHLILRMPKDDPLTPEFRDIIRKRKELPADFNITWKDQRKGTMTFMAQTLFVRLVDLPCIIESQKTVDRKRFYKTADISQLIIVERLSPEQMQAALQKSTKSSEHAHSSGITPPLKYCRQRRFRKGVNRKRVENIENEVNRLLKADMEALEVVETFLEPAELEKRLADEEERLAAAGEEDGNAEEELSAQVDVKDAESDDESVDSELAAELEDEIARAVEEGSSGGEDEDGFAHDEHEQEEEEQEEGEEYDEATQALVDKQKLLREEMRDLEEKIVEKSTQRQKSVNIIMQKRFDDIIARLQNERELKESQLMELDMNIEEARQEANDAAEATGKNNAEPSPAPENMEDNQAQAELE